MHMAEMTTDDFKKAVKKDPIVMIPLGATEAHGSHLPLSADTIQPEFIAYAVDSLLDNILVAPPLNYALHSTTKNLPGTINLTFDTVRAVIYDMLTSLYEQGIRKIVVITGHAGSGHMTAVSEACKKVVKETNAQIIFFADCDIGEECSELTDVKNDGHGGLAESSRVLAIRPDLVRCSRPIGEYAGKKYVVHKNASVCFPVGIVGDTTKASAELGTAINDYIIERIIGIIQNDFE